MSERIVEAIQVPAIEPHTNADTLGVVKVHGGYPCIVKLGDFREGETALYVPVDMLVPADDPAWAFLGRGSTPKVIGNRSYWRVKAIRLRGVFSMGVLVHVPEGMEVSPGIDYAPVLGMIPYEPPEPLSTGGEDEKDPGFLPGYDIEGLRRWPDVLEPGEEVALTEKVHGACGRFAWHRDRLWVASHRNIKRDVHDEPGKTQTIWWRAAYQYRLHEVLAQARGIALYGEVYGQVQDLKYGVQPGCLRLAFFDALEIETRRWLDYDDFRILCGSLGLPVVPELYLGPWSPELISHAEGPSAFADHVREGFVVRPVRERWNDSISRVILKVHGEGFQTRKETK